MPIAAVPEYLQQHFAKFHADASPGLRFGLYLPIWTMEKDQRREIQERAQRGSEEAAAIKRARERGGREAVIRHQRARGVRMDQVWGKTTAAANAAWKRVTALSATDVALNEALSRRIEALADATGEGSKLLRIDALAVAPFTTGLGNAHPLENGFAFLSPYGLPYLAGSGVKGVLRQAARELADGDWGDTHGWHRDPVATIQSGRTPLQLDPIELLFGRESADHDSEMFRGVLSIWDVLPRIEGNTLLVEVMTPHQSRYYQGQEHPHDSGQPNPIFFLTVPPGSRFVFHVVCDTVRLGKLAPQLADSWQALLRAAMEHAFAWLGFGAKTAVGYGAMDLDHDAVNRRAEREEEARVAREKAAAEARREAELASMSPVDRLIAEAVERRQDGQSATSAVFAAIRDAGLDDATRQEAATKLKSLMEHADHWCEISKKKRPEKDRNHRITLQVMQWLKNPS